MAHRTMTPWNLNLLSSCFDLQGYDDLLHFFPNKYHNWFFKSHQEFASGTGKCFGTGICFSHVKTAQTCKTMMHPCTGWPVWSRCVWPSVNFQFPHPKQVSGMSTEDYWGPILHAKPFMIIYFLDRISMQHSMMVQIILLGGHIWWA